MEYECLPIATLSSQVLKEHWRVHLVVRDFLQEINFHCQFISQIYKTTFLVLSSSSSWVFIPTLSVLQKAFDGKRLSTAVDSWMKFAY